MKTYPLSVQLDYLRHIVERHDNCYYEVYDDSSISIKERRREILSPEIFALLDFSEACYVANQSQTGMLRCMVSVNDIEKMYYYLDIAQL